MTGGLVAAVATATGSEVVATAPARGGDINDAVRMSLADGRELFVKFRAGAPPGMYQAEAHGLAWLGAAPATPLPEVIALGEEREPRFLALEWIEPGSLTSEGAEAFGRNLAKLHRSGGEAFGLATDNFIGNLDQPNATRDTWAEFYAERRLLPLTRTAIEGGSLPPRTAGAMDRLVARLDDLAGPPEPPARLHGDLWSGNAHAAADGTVYLVDPAVYGGHREMDLAMMRLFGGFSTATFDAYQEEHPLADGHEDRVELYQLYPLLVHTVLFGAHYGASVERVLRGYAGR